jgi:hypothetical protein
MTVKELIAKLSEVDNQYLPAIISDHCGNGQGFAKSFEIVNIISSEGPVFDALEISVVENNY